MTPVTKIAHINKNGQIVIPAKIREYLHISEDTHIRISLEANSQKIWLEPEKTPSQKEKEENIISFPKKDSFMPFSFKSKNKKETNLAGQIDDILYS